MMLADTALSRASSLPHAFGRQLSFVEMKNIALLFAAVFKHRLEKPLTTQGVK
jgi:hypothetical protein